MKIVSDFRSFVTRAYKNGVSRIPRKRVTRTVRNRPFLSFFLALLVLFVIIVIGSILTQPSEDTVPEVPVTEVKVYSIGTGPTITTQAQINKTGVIRVVAQTQGIVQKVHVTEGDSVQRGNTLVSLSTNYSGGNAPAISAQIAREQYQNTKETFDTQKELIDKQRQVANNTFDNTDELREISEQSLSDSQNLLTLNETILGTIDQQLRQAEQAGDEQALLTARQTRAQLQSGVSQLQNTIRTLEYQTDEDNPPTELSELQREITLKQLEVQEKSLTLSKEVSRLQLQLAQVQASLMYPSSPSNGTVQKVHVVFGQSVNPGTLIATIFQPEHEIMATVNLNAKTALSVSRSETSTLTLTDGTSIRLAPRFVSTEATDGQLYSIIYTIPDEYSRQLTDQEFIPLQIPLAIPDTSSVIPLIPIDAVYKTENSAYVFTAQNGIAVATPVEVGEITGSYIEIQSGLTSGDMVILNRNVVEGERVIVSSI